MICARSVAFVFAAHVLVLGAEAGAKDLLRLKAKAVVAGQKVYLMRQGLLGPRRIDSATVTGGQAVFAARPGFVRGPYEVGPGADKHFEVILSDKEIVQAEVQGQDWAKATISASKENQSATAQRQAFAATEKGMEALQQQYNEMAKVGFSETEQLTYAALFKRRADSLYKVQDVALLRVAGQHPGTFAAKTSTWLVPSDNDQEKTFFPGTQAQDPELGQLPIVRRKMTLWYQRFLPQELEAYQAATLEAVDRTAPGSTLRQATLASAAGMFLQMDQDYARRLLKLWTAQYPEDPEGRRLLTMLPPPQPEVGDLAPDIVLKDSAGRDMALSSLRGKVVLIDFWASWCGPCRAENPNVVATYGKYKDKGFTIFSVSLDQSRPKWLAAISKDGLTWPNHVSDLAGWGSAGAKLYSVQSIPATFLIGKDGKILAKNLRGARLEQELAKLL